MWPFWKKNGLSGFSFASTAEEVSDGVDGTGLTAIVTGASSGIGAETARVLAKCGVHVVMAVRNTTSGNIVREEILKESPTSNVDVQELDLSSFASVRKFASDFNASNLPLNILINNAGVLATPYLLSHDDIELQFATNHLGHFLLTDLLLENMKKASRNGKEGRIVNVSSDAHKRCYREGIRFDKINDQPSYSSWGAYGQSKLANILHANQLSMDLKDCGAQVTANSLHPGVITTNIFRGKPYEGILLAAGRFFMKNVQQGAATTCYVAMHPQVSGVSGQYFSDCNIANRSDMANSEELAKKLWDFSLRMVSSEAWSSGC